MATIQSTTAHSLAPENFMSIPRSTYIHPTFPRHYSLNSKSKSCKYQQSHVSLTSITNHQGRGPGQLPLSLCLGHQETRHLLSSRSDRQA